MTRGFWGAGYFSDEDTFTTKKIQERRFSFSPCSPTPYIKCADNEWREAWKQRKRRKLRRESRKFSKSRGWWAWGGERGEWCEFTRTGKWERAEENQGNWKDEENQETKVRGVDRRGKKGNGDVCSWRKKDSRMSESESKIHQYGRPYINAEILSRLLVMPRISRVVWIIFYPRRVLVSCVELH